jgi:1-acyl-sn-glycerol-3-phosphate acyltransferase
VADPQQIPAGEGPSLIAGSLVLRLAYGLYAWTLFVALAAAAVPVLLLMPRLSRRRALVRRLAGTVLMLIGMRLRIQGLERIQPPCVVVANHSSYLDGVVMAAAMPPSFSFVIKREMASFPLAGTLLRRIGAEFVERQDRSRSSQDARRLIRHAVRGQALVFFPEGTFSERVGLLRFHIGAFAAAARADMAVIPVAIRGTRACLPPGHMLPVPGTIDVQVLAALPGRRPGSTAEEPDRPVVLRDSARAVLLAALGEPDLAQQADA